MDILGAKSHLKIGMEGTFEGTKYKIIGRVKYSVFDSYENRRYLWDEWFLISELGRRLWLVEDEWRFKLNSAFTPKTPFDPNRAGKIIELDGQTLTVKERGKARIEHYEGELNYKPEVGTEVNFLDIGDTYSVDWDEKEIKFYKRKAIHVDNVYKGFGLDINLIPAEAFGAPAYEDPYQEIPKSIDIKTDNNFYHYDAHMLSKRQAISNKNNIPYLLLISGILLILLSFLVDSLPKANNTIYITPTTVEDSKVEGPINLTKEGMLHMISIEEENTNYNLSIELLDSNKKKIWWCEQTAGWDDEDACFYLADKGEYYLKSTIKSTDNTAAPSLTMKIYEPVVNSIFYYWAGLILFIIAIFRLLFF